MKITVRNGVWETNSSSVHSLTIVTEEDFAKWLATDLYYDIDFGTFVEEENEDALTHIDWMYRYNHLDQFTKSFTTPSGDKMVAFGYYGFNG